MKKVLQVALGIVTSVGGFLEVGSISTAAQAGAVFRFRLLWALLLAAVLVMFLLEMSGRLAAVSRHTLAGAVRERFGIHFQVVPLAAEVIVDTLVLGAEIGGVCVALQLLTGVSYRWWALPVAASVWLLLWRGTFGLIENGVAVLGLITVCFVVAAWKARVPWAEAARGFLPTLPGHHPAQYGFLAVSLVGATLSPHLVNFYSSGAVEEKWDRTYLAVNRLTAVLGMAFGGLIAASVLALSALFLEPRGIRVDDYGQLALMMADVFPYWGFLLLAASLAVGCFGAALEIGLNLSYLLAQAGGWNWSEDLKPCDDTRFSLVYTVAVFASSLLMLAGIDPLKLTMFSMALTALILPAVVFPFLILMNDPRYLREHTNGWLGNLAVALITALAFVLAAVAIPLQIAGGG